MTAPDTNTIDTAASARELAHLWSQVKWLEEAYAWGDVSREELDAHYGRISRLDPAYAAALAAYDAEAR